MAAFPPVIGADVEPPPTGFATALAANAAALALAYGETLVRARAGDPARWRAARLLWPLFTKG